MSKYPISKQFGMFSRFTPPWNRAAFSLASVLLKCVPKHAAGVSVKKFKAEGVPLIVMLPKCNTGHAKLPCLVYFHGGGMVFRAAPYHYRNAAIYAREAGCAVVMPDYRLAYKCGYPAAHEDCLSALRWTVQNAARLNIDSSRIAVGGDSAGGLLAADTARADGACFLFLVYPVLDRRCGTHTMRAYTDTPMWNAALNKEMWQLYLAGNSDYVSPAECDVGVLPNAYIETAEFDCLKDEGEEFAAKLASCGRSVTLNSTRGTMHGFDIVKNCDITRAALDKRVEALKAAFDKR